MRVTPFSSQGCTPHTACLHTPVKCKSGGKDEDHPSIAPGTRKAIPSRNLAIGRMHQGIPADRINANASAEERAMRARL